jgi:hypothetical protein
MKALELLEKYPKAGKIVNKWFLDKMLKSLNTDTVPEEFKEYISNQPIDNQNIAVMIDNNPRVLFDVFDENEIYINITRLGGKFMSGYSNDIDQHIKDNLFITRKEAEFDAIESAFELLDKNL